MDPLALVACGNIIPAPFTSTTNVLYVRFVSDAFVEDEGLFAN